MARPKIITGLDIGTSNIKILSAIRKNEESNFETIVQTQEPSLGVRRGIVIDVEKVSRLIQIILDKIKTENNQKVNSVYVNIGGSHLFSTSSRGMVAVSRADQKISEEDVDRVIQSAESFSLPVNKEILEVLPKEFIVDGEGQIKEVIGMQGGRLETEVLILAGFSPYKKNLTQAVLGANLQISDITPSVLGSASAVLSQKQKELGVAVLDIGAGTSELAVFEEGGLIHLAVFPIGSANITSDIAIGLKTDIDTAEKIKIELGSCLFKGSNKKERIEIDEGEPLIFSRKTMNRIIEARVLQIFMQVQKELKKISKQELLPAGIVLTGGGAKLPKIIDVAKKELKLPCRLGKPLNFSGLDDDPSFSTVCGLVLRAVDFEEEKGWQKAEKFSATEKQGFKNKIKKLFRIFIP